MTKARTLADNFAADINGITAGTGITGGGTSGTVTVTNSMATAIDAKGDLVVGTGADTFSRLAVASTAGYLLSVDSGETTGLKWAAPAGGAKSFTLLNAGGTALTAAQTITVSGISGQDVLYVFILDASSASANSNICVRVNGVTTSTYGIFASQLTAQASYSAGFLKRESTLSNDRIIIADTSSNAASQVAAYCRIDGAATSGIKMFQFAGTGNDGGGNNQEQWVGGGLLNTTAITEVNIFSTVGNFDNGTVYIYGSA